MNRAMVLEELAFSQRVVREGHEVVLNRAATVTLL